MPKSTSESQAQITYLLTAPEPARGHFPGELGQLVPLHFLPQPVPWEPLWISDTGYYGPDVLPVTQPTVSKHRGKHKSLTPTSGLTSSFLHPPPASWRGVAPFMSTLQGPGTQRAKHWLPLMLTHVHTYKERYYRPCVRPTPCHEELSAAWLVSLNTPATFLHNDHCYETK